MENKMFHLAQINIAYMLGDRIDDPQMIEFVNNIERINQLAENHEGFIWRYQEEEIEKCEEKSYFKSSQIFRREKGWKDTKIEEVLNENNPRLLINMSVWENYDSLYEYVFKTMHAEIMKRRAEWFTRLSFKGTALWWVRAGELPSVEDGFSKLYEPKANGPSKKVFNFSKVYNSGTS